jgi:hypothetical protein
MPLTAREQLMYISGGKKYAVERLPDQALN